MKMFFTEIYVEKIIRSAHPPQKITIFSYFPIFVLIKLPWSTFHVKNTANLQSRAGQNFFCGVQPSICGLGAAYLDIGL